MVDPGARERFVVEPGGLDVDVVRALARGQDDELAPVDILELLDIVVGDPPPDCSPAAGKPTYNNGDARAVYIWKDDCTSSNWKIRVTGGGSSTPLRYKGGVQSTLPFASAEGVKLENADNIDEISAQRFEYDLSVLLAGEDGIDLEVSPGSSTCFVRSSIVSQALVGRI